LTAPQKLLPALQSVLKAVHLKTNQDTPNDVSDVSPSEIHNIIADDLIASENGVIVLGEHLNSNPNSLAIINLIEKIASATNLKIANITISGNSHSAEKANFIPSGNGLNAISMFNDNTKAFLLMDVDSEYDFIDSKSAQGHFSKEDVFVVALSSFENQSTLTSADVILPMASFYESSGTHINFDGLVQSYSASVKSPGESKPGWKIIKVMADLLDLQGFDYVDSTQVKEEALQSSKVKSSVDEANIQSIDDSQVTTHWQYAPYASDSVTRRAKALQESNVGMINRAYVSKMTAHKIGLSDDDLYLGVPVSIEESVAEDCVFIHTNQARRA
jgi:NADH-quinone oxidoreductase subunit G